MSIRDDRAKYSGFGGLAGGVDSGRSTFLLGETRLSWLVNGTMRGGFVVQRPGWVNHALRFLAADASTDTVLAARFKTEGRYQGAHSHIADNGTGVILTSIGGRIFRVDISNYEVTDLTAQSGFTNNPIAPRSWWVQAENYLLHQNASDAMTIYDGATLRQANSYALGGDELPGGSVMAYVGGRVWLASHDGTSFVAGDQVYSDGTRAAVLKITENQYLTGGGAFTNRGAFAAPAGIGPIRAMTSLAVQDSSTGQGALQVLGPLGAFSINVSIPRDQWQTTTNPVQTVSLLGFGSVSQESTVLVNGDAWYRSLDGVRSYLVAQRDHGTWVNTPLSREVSRAIDFDSAALLDMSSGALFDNRLLMTVRPEIAATASGTIRGTIHKGLVALDFSPISSMFERTQPSWDGVWTGLDILQVLTVATPTGTRCFAFVLNADSEIELWELTAANRFDSYDNRVSWIIETPSYGFERGGWAQLRLAYADIWLNRIAGTVDVTVKYRCDSDPEWRTWSTFQVCADVQACDIDSCGACVAEGYRTRIRLPAPTAICDTVTGKPTDLGFRFAARLEITGHCQVPQFRLVARDEPEDAVGGCPDTTCTLQAIAVAPANDYQYSTLL